MNTKTSSLCKRISWSFLIIGLFSSAMPASAQTIRASAARFPKMYRSYTQGQGQRQHAAPPTATSTRAIQMQLAWLADPVLFRLKLRVQDTPSGPKVVGLVPNEALRKRVLDSAARVNGAPVLDGLQVVAGSGMRMDGFVPAAEMTRQTARLLRMRVPRSAPHLRISVTKRGHVVVYGHVASLQEKLAVCECIRRVPGCNGLVNHLLVGLPASTSEPPMVARAPARQYTPKRMPVGQTAMKYQTPSSATSRRVGPVKHLTEVRLTGKPQATPSTPAQPVKNTGVVPAVHKTVKPETITVAQHKTTPQPAPSKYVVHAATPANVAMPSKLPPALLNVSKQPIHDLGHPRRTYALVSLVPPGTRHTPSAGSPLHPVSAQQGQTPMSTNTSRPSASRVKYLVERACGAEVQRVDVCYKSDGTLHIKYVVGNQALATAMYHRIVAINELGSKEDMHLEAEVLHGQ